MKTSADSKCMCSWLRNYIIGCMKLWMLTKSIENEVQYNDKRTSRSGEMPKNKFSVQNSFTWIKLIALIEVVFHFAWIGYVKLALTFLNDDKVEMRVELIFPQGKFAKLCCSLLLKQFANSLHIVELLINSYEFLSLVYSYFRLDLLWEKHLKYDF